MGFTYSDIKSLEEEELIYEFAKYQWVMEESRKANTVVNPPKK